MKGPWITGKTEVVSYLRCPVCADRLAAGGAPAARTLRCPRGHSFDIARQGYVHLAAGRAPHSGDTPAMVAARDRFLAAGHYDFLSTALAAAARDAVPVAAARRAGGPDLVLDAGAGTGHHLAAVLDALPGSVGLALDSSKPALRRAARAHPRAGAVLCDTWRRLPVADDAAAVLLNVFAPRNGPEFRRTLRADGLLLVAAPTAGHLAELVETLGLLRVDPDKPARVAAGLGDRLIAAYRQVLSRRLRLTHADVTALVGMGPSAWHTDPAALADRVAALPEPMLVTASVSLTGYRTRQ